MLIQLTVEDLSLFIKVNWAQSGMITIGLLSSFIFETPILFEKIIGPCIKSAFSLQTHSERKPISNACTEEQQLLTLHDLSNGQNQYLQACTMKKLKRMAEVSSKQRIIVQVWQIPRLYPPSDTNHPVPA